MTLPFLKLPMQRLALLAALLAALLSGCRAAEVTPTRVVPEATRTPDQLVQPSPTPYPTETPRPSPTSPPTQVPTAGPTATFTPDPALNEIEMIGLAWYDDYNMMVSFRFPGPVRAEDYLVTLEDKPYNCEVLEQYPDRLYCIGQGARVLGVADVRVYAAGQSEPGFEKEVWVPYFSNDYGDVLQ